MSILNSLLNNKKVRTQKLHITNSSIFRKIRNLLFYRNLLQPRQCSDMRFLCPNPYVIKVMNAKLTHPYLFIVDFLNKPRQSWSRIDFWVLGNYSSRQKRYLHPSNMIDLYEFWQILMSHRISVNTWISISFLVNYQIILVPTFTLNPFMLVWNVY